MAPEVFSNKGYSYKADIFSLGSVFFSLLTGYYLFDGDTDRDLLQSNLDCELDNIDEYLSPISPYAKDLFHKMVSKDPANRPTAKEALLHPWFMCDKAVLKELLQMNNMVCQLKKAASKKNIEIGR